MNESSIDKMKLVFLFLIFLVALNQYLLHEAYNIFSFKYFEYLKIGLIDAFIAFIMGSILNILICARFNE